MEFGWSEEQRESLRQARAFAEQELGSGPPGDAGEGPRGGAGGTGEGAGEGGQVGGGQTEFLRRWLKCADFGVQALVVPSAYGGLGAEALAAVAVLEGLGQGSADNGLLLALGAEMWSVTTPLARLGSEEQKRRWLPRLATGESVGAFALTEPESGSDAFRLRTRARREGSGFRLDGIKTFVTNAPVADLILVFAATSPEAGYFGLTAFLLESTAAGVTVGAPLAKMGLESSPMAEIRLDAVWAGPDAVLGEVGGGAAVAAFTLEWERGLLLAPALGTLERLLRRTTAYCRARRQFGRPIHDFEAVGARLAEMRLRLELSRLLVYQFAWRKDQGLASGAEASMTKLYLSESLRSACAHALHLHGAAGYCRELGLEQDWRDAMASSLYSGTTEMNLNLLAETLLRPEARAAAESAVRPGNEGGQ